MANIENLASEFKKKELSDDEKQAHIDRFKNGLENIRDLTHELEEDIQSSDLKNQAAAIWITGNLLHFFTSFMEELKKLDKKSAVDGLKEQIEEAISVTEDLINE